MKKGVILSMDKHFLTLLTPEGEFHRSKKQEALYEIGKEIYFFPYDVNKSKAPLRFFYTRPAFVSAIVSILLILSFLPSYFNEKVFAYVTIDINPSIEISLNENLRVVDLYGINKKGLVVIEKIRNWENTDVSTMTTMIVKATKDSGYANNKHQILVSATLLKNDQVLTKKLDKKLEEISKQQVVPEVDVKIIKATVNERSKAKEQGISTGTYIENKRKKDHQKKGQDNKKSIPVKESSPNTLNKSSLPVQQVKRVAVPVERKSDTEAIQGSKVPVAKAKSVDVTEDKKEALVVKQKEVKGEKKKTQKQVVRQQSKNSNQQSTVSNQKINNPKKKENQPPTGSDQQNKQKENQPNSHEYQKSNQREEKQRQINRHKEKQNSGVYNQKHKIEPKNDKQIKGEQQRKEKEHDNRGYRTKHEHF